VTNRDATTADPLDAARRRIVAAMPEHIERMRWAADRLAQWRTGRLRALLAVAVERSPYHRHRLAGVDVARFDLADLASLPVMSKQDMMDHFDEALTTPDLTRSALEAHLETVTEGPRLHRGEYLPVVSGGSSGVRGLFVYDRNAMVEYLCGVLRNGLAAMLPIVGWPPNPPVPLTMVAAPSAMHATRAMLGLAEGSVATSTSAPATLPFDEIVRRVQLSQPMVLVGYATTIARLADEQAAGRLRIEPKVVLTTSEQLTDALSGRIAAGFGAPPANSYATSEGLVGSAPPSSDVFSFAGDLAVVEFVDANDRPLPAGATAHHVLVTNLFNHIQPLIRYRLDDRMIECPPSADHGQPRARLRGRTNETHMIGGATIHPLTIGTVMLRYPAVIEYQVRYTATSVRLDVVAGDHADLTAIEADVASGLAAAGSTGVGVSARLSTAIERDPHTGKALRFEPL
jgi:phenylacetate-coenzyme A ligase PaaK-like adenylate-forming protein